MQPDQYDKVYRRRCSEETILGHYDPTNARPNGSTNVEYERLCRVHSPHRCELGDLTRKLGQIRIDSTFEVKCCSDQFIFEFFFLSFIPFFYWWRSLTLLQLFHFITPYKFILSSFFLLYLVFIPLSPYLSPLPTLLWKNGGCQIRWERVGVRLGRNEVEQEEALMAKREGVEWRGE